MPLRLGSLFDGSGGFPLAGRINGIIPVWASEIEPFPVKVTRKNFPDMLHLGDITKIRGNEIPTVDIISFGSPCQDLSLAGKREGLTGTRSNLFYDAIRIVKEMREITNGMYPRYVIWENVYGAFSSNKGEDFRNVIESITKIKHPECTIPMPTGGKWCKSGFILDKQKASRFSLAWRGFDAQFWGVPQRRKRIYLVADFGGGSAPEILFNESCMLRDSSEVAGTWEKDSRSVRDGTENTGRDCDIKYTPLENHPADGRIKLCENNKVQTLSSRAGTGGNNVPLILEQKVYSIGAFNSCAMLSSNPNAGIYEAGISRTLDNTGMCPERNQGGIAICSTDTNTQYSIRRFTPLECCRLQGFPDDWCSNLETHNPTEKDIQLWDKVFRNSGKPKTEKQILKFLQSKHSDSAEYKMWGNGIALPCADFIMKNIVKFSNTF